MTPARLAPWVLAGVLVAAAGPRVAGAAPAPPPVRLSADTVTADSAAVDARGDVVLTFPDQVCRVERATLDRATDRLTLTAGTCESGLGDVAFQQAEVDLSGHAGVLVEARLEPEGMVVTADRLVRLDPAHLEGEGAWVSLCSCDPGPWSLEARTISVTADEVVRFQGGWIRVCRLRVVPVPVGALPLSPRRTGLLPPQVGWGRDGAVVATPVMVTMGSWADLVAAPEWRQARGWRGLGEARVGLAPGGEGITASGFGGWDASRGEARGALSVQEGWTPGFGRTALDAQWLTDGDVLADYGDSFLSRAAPWTERRALVGLGPARLETDRFTSLAGEGLSSRLVSGVVAQRGIALGPVSWGGSVRVDGMGDSVQSTIERTRLLAATGVQSGLPLGPARLTGHAGLRGSSWDDTRGRVLGHAGGAALLDLWGDVGPLRHLAALGVDARAAGWTGDPRWRLRDERPPPAWQLGPTAQSTWVSAGGVPLRLEGRVPWTPTGVRPVGLATVALGAWQAAAQGRRSLQELRVVRDDGVLRLGGGATHAQGLLVAQGEGSWRLPGPLEPWRPGVAGARDLEEGRWLSRTVSLTWRSRCDCLGATVGATWSADRAVPDWLGQVTLR